MLKSEAAIVFFEETSGSPWTGPEADLWLNALQAASDGTIGVLETPAILRQAVGVAPVLRAVGEGDKPGDPYLEVLLAQSTGGRVEPFMLALPVWDRNDWKTIARARRRRFARRLLLRIWSSCCRMMHSHHRTRPAARSGMIHVPFDSQLTGSQFT